MENTNKSTPKRLTEYPVLRLFDSRHNERFYEVMKHSDCHCVIDGSRAPHELWNLNPHWKLSNEANFAVIVENFFKSLSRANITPHVLFLEPKRGFNELVRAQYGLFKCRMQYLDSSDWKKTTSMQSRIIFNEVVKALGVHHFFAEDSYETMASYAKGTDAFVISGSNFLFFTDIPRGYLQFKHLPLDRLRYGLIDFVGLTYHREKFLNSFRCVETDKMKSIALFATLISPFNDELLKEFREARDLEPRASVFGINLPKEFLAPSLLFVTDKPFEDAQLTIHKYMYPDARELFKRIYEYNYDAFASHELISYESGDITPKLTGYLECESHGDESQDSESSSDEECSEEGSDEDSVKDELLPAWFKETVQSEAFGGYWGNKLQSMVALLATGCFYPLHHLQDSSDYSACFASLRVRRALYGIMFQDLRKQRQGEGSFDSINAFRVKEYAGIRKKLCQLRVEPIWSLADAMEPREIIELPGLHEMEDLDIATRKRIFAVAMVGSSGWLDTLGPNAHGHEYNLLLLRSWAKRSPNLEKVHVIVLLLTFLAIEAKYNKETRFFPWPISFRKGVVLQSSPLTAVIRYECLQPFAQLQSTTDIAFYLNSALASPHGLRVESIREFYSEVLFHDLLVDWSCVSEEERTELLSSLFDEECLKNFLSFVHALYGDEDESERAPLRLVRSEEGFSSDEILGKVSRMRVLDNT